MERKYNNEASHADKNVDESNSLIYQQQYTQCIPQVGFREGGVHVTLLMQCEGRNIVSNKSFAQIKHIKSSIKRKYNNEASHTDNTVDESNSLIYQYQIQRLWKNTMVVEIHLSKS